MKARHILPAVAIGASALGVLAAFAPNASTSLLPNTHLTPGAINSNITTTQLCDPTWHTSDERNTVTSEAQKEKVYQWYGIPKPPNNTGQNQKCELDHLISLELGGADTLDNIWPQCGPDWPNTSHAVPLAQRYFKQKDIVENRCHKEVCDGTITLAEAQKEIASDWLTACK